MAQLVKSARLWCQRSPDRNLHKAKKSCYGYWLVARVVRLGKALHSHLLHSTLVNYIYMGTGLGWGSKQVSLCSGLATRSQQCIIIWPTAMKRRWHLWMHWKVSPPNLPYFYFMFLHTVPDNRDPYIGCYIDKGTRALPHHVTSAADMTIEKCLSHCRSFGDVLFAGVQSSNQCFCGNDYDRYGEVAETQCRRICQGNTQQYCGGTWRNSVYSLAGKA